jgi:hypothetical protein
MSDPLPIIAALVQSQSDDRKRFEDERKRFEDERKRFDKQLADAWAAQSRVAEESRAAQKLFEERLRAELNAKIEQSVQQIQLRNVLSPTAAGEAMKMLRSSTAGYAPDASPLQELWFGMCFSLSLINCVLC